MAERRITRQFRLLILLRSRESISAKELAERCSVNIRTIYRDVEDLLQSGVPIEGVPGPDGGYRLRPEAAVEPTIFDSEDAFRTYLLQLSGDGAESTTALGTGKPSAEQSEFARLFVDGKIYFDPTDTYWRDEGSGLVPDVRQALAKSEAVSIQRTSMHKPRGGRPKEEVVVPLGLVWKAGHWYLVARDLNGQVFRERLINLALVRPVGLLLSTPESFELEAWWKAEMELFGKGDTRVVFVADRESARELRKLNRKDTSIFEDLSDGRLRITLLVDDWRWLIPIIASYGSGVLVEEPVELRQELHRFLSAAAARYYEGDYLADEDDKPQSPNGDIRLRATRGR